MKATLTFDLPDDRREFAIAVAAPDLLSAICDIDEHIRQRIKNADLSEETCAEMEELRKRIHDELTVDMVGEL